MEVIDKILSTDIHEAIKVYEDDLKRLGNELYGIRCGSCGNRLIEIYLKLSKNGHQIIKNKMERKAKLKKGVVLRVGALGITWTNDSLSFTDEAALKAIKEFPALANQFEILPNDKNALDRDELKEEAKSLKLEFASNIPTNKLKELIDKRIEDNQFELELLKEEAVELEIEFSDDVEMEALKKLIEDKKSEQNPE